MIRTSRWLLATLPLWLSVLPALGPTPQRKDKDEPVDRVELKDGKTHEGRIVLVDDSTLVLRQGSRDRELELEDIASYRSIAEDHARLMERAQRVAPEDLLGNLGLVEEAQELGLNELSQLFAWRVLASHPGEAQAHVALGHRKRGERYVIPCRGRHYTMDRRVMLAEEFDDAWELESTHYRLRSNLPLGKAVALTLDLERLYLEFFRLFGKDWRLYEVLVPLVAHVHADPKSYPRQGREGGYFSPGEDVLRVDASTRVDVRLVMHEGVHQLFHATSDGERAYGGRLPAWLDEGMAEYLGASATGAPGDVRFDVGRVDPGHVRRVLEVKKGKGFALKRVLALSVTDFTATSGELRYAQSWSLVHFLLHSGEADLAPRFHAFVRSAYSGKGSPSHAKKALGLKPKELEALWRAHLERLAGA